MEFSNTMRVRLYIAVYIIFFFFFLMFKSKTNMYNLHSMHISSLFESEHTKFSHVHFQNDTPFAIIL